MRNLVMYHVSARAITYRFNIFAEKKKRKKIMYYLLLSIKRQTEQKIKTFLSWHGYYLEDDSREFEIFLVLFPCTQ